MKTEMINQAVAIMQHFPPHINAQIVVDARENLELFKDQPEKQGVYEAQIEAAFEIESANTGVVDFLKMVEEYQAKG